MDDSTVVENQLIAKELSVVDTTIINNLVVKGSINVDNRSWNTLAATIGDRALGHINDVWRESLVDQVSEKIKTQGIDFSQVTIEGSQLVNGNKLSSAITQSNIQTLGVLESLQVNGNVDISKTLSVRGGRVGVNTLDPDSAFSIWDEEVNVVTNKYKNQEAFIGTGKHQTLHLGTNREPQLSITNDGITTVKKLRVAQHQISFSGTLPGWAGVRGDIVFNSNPVPNSAFGWVCLGDYKWKVLKVLE